MERKMTKLEETKRTIMRCLNRGEVWWEPTPTERRALRELEREGKVERHMLHKVWRRARRRTR